MKNWMLLERLEMLAWFGLLNGSEHDVLLGDCISDRLRM